MNIEKLKELFPDKGIAERDGVFISSEGLLHSCNLSETVARWKRETGFHVTPEGFILACGTEDEAQFAKLVTMLQEGISLGAITSETPVTIKDRNGALHTVTVQRCREILFSYGLHCKEIWDSSNN